jgi:hypothetical protein
MFGSKNGGAKVRIRDSHLTDECRTKEDWQGYLREQPHFGSPKPGKRTMRPEESVLQVLNFGFILILITGLTKRQGS